MDDPYVNLRHTLLDMGLRTELSQPASAAAYHVDSLVETYGPEQMAAMCAAMDYPLTRMAVVQSVTGVVALLRDVENELEPGPLADRVTAVLDALK